MRDHFGELLREFRKRSTKEGPVSRQDLYTLKASQGFAEGDTGVWVTMIYPDGENATSVFVLLSPWDHARVRRA